MNNTEGLCHAIREEGLLIRLLDGELSPTEEHKVLTHLRTCHECLGLTADLLYTDTRLKEMFDRQEAQPESTKKKSADRFLLEVDKLPIGKALDRDLLDEDGRLLVAAGIELTSKLVDGLKRRGILKLAFDSTDTEDEKIPDDVRIPKINIRQIEDLVAESAIEPAVSEYVRRQCTDAVNRCFENLEKDGNIDVAEIHESTQQVTEEVLSHPQVALTLADIILVDSSLHAHSVNVLILFLMIGRAMGHPAQLIRDHTTAALLHDVGRVVLRRVAVASGFSKSKEEEDAEHTEAGYSYLWNMGIFKESALKMVMNHHERYDGGGYPRGLKGTAISDWDQILILANTYDNLTWDRKTGVRSGFHKALSTIIQDGSKYVRKGIIRTLIQTFGHYPPGSWVRMNNGEVGLVTKAHPGSPLKPQLSIMYDSSGRKQSKPRIVDLLHSQSAYITGPATVETTV